MDNTIKDLRTDLLREIEALRDAVEYQRQWHYDRTLAKVYALLAALDREQQLDAVAAECEPPRAAVTITGESPDPALDSKRAQLARAYGAAPESVVEQLQTDLANELVDFLETEAKKTVQLGVRHWLKRKQLGLVEAGAPEGCYGTPDAGFMEERAVALLEEINFRNELVDGVTYVKFIEAKPARQWSFS